MTRILLADDHYVVRSGLRALLEAEKDFEVVGEASDGLEADEMVESLRPDVLVVDAVMPGLSGIEVARRASWRSPRTRVVVLSMYEDEAYVVEALQAGAKAYVLKRSSSDELLRAIREAIAGGYYLDRPLAGRAIELYRQTARHSAEDLYKTLTPREREVLHLVAEGLTSAEVARRLSISRRTAENHRVNLMHKLGVRNSADLIRYALQRGIIPPDNRPSPL